MLTNKNQKAKIDPRTYLYSNHSKSTFQKQSYSNQQIISSQNQKYNLPPMKQIITSSNQSNKKYKIILFDYQIQLKSIAIQQKMYKNDKNIIWLDYQPDNQVLAIFFQQKAIKYKLQVTRQQINGKRVKINYNDGICILQVKHLLIRRQDFKLSQQMDQVVYDTGFYQGQQTVVLWMKQPSHIRALMVFPIMEGLPDEFSTSVLVQIPKQIVIQEEQQDPYGDDIVTLSLPQQNKAEQCQRVRKLISQMNQQQKNSVLIDIFKIRRLSKHPLIPYKPRCPINHCDKRYYKDINQLRNHIRIKHPQLRKNGIQLQNDGTFKYSQKAIDLALYIGKMYPQEMKKIIKQTKIKYDQ